MTWFQVDDGFYSHPKVASIPRAVRAEAIGTWTLAGTYSADKLTDGVIATYLIEEIGGSIAGAEALVKAKLWRKTRAGFVFVKWEKYQRTRSQVEQARAIERDRKAAYRAGTRKNKGDEGDGVPTGQSRNPALLSSSSSYPPTEELTIDPPVPKREGFAQAEDGGVDKSLSAIVDMVREVSGKTIDQFAAVDLRDWIDKRRAKGSEPIKRPERYYPGVIRNDWHEVERLMIEREMA